MNLEKQHGPLNLEGLYCYPGGLNVHDPGLKRYDATPGNAVESLTTLP